MSEKKARTAAIALRLPWLYTVNGRGPKPGSTALLSIDQLRAVRKAVKRARRDNVISRAVADRELAEVKKGIEIIESGPRSDVGAWIPADEASTHPDRRLQRRRRKNKAERQARKAGRPEKKPRR